MVYLQQAEPSGAALLDVAYPLWELAVNPEKIQLASSKHCVLGKLFGSFEAGCKALGITLEQAITLGFHAPKELTKMLAKQYYAALEGPWTYAIERRMPAYI